jgi:hypothetical protein
VISPAFLASERVVEFVVEGLAGGSVRERALPNDREDLRRMRSMGSWLVRNVRPEY